MNLVKDFVNKNKHLLSNDERISSASERGYFGLSFFLESKSYVDIMTAFKKNNKPKRICPDAEVIVLSLLDNKNHYLNIYRIVIFLWLLVTTINLPAQSPLTKIINFETTNSPIADALIDLSEAANIDIAFHPRLFEQQENISLSIKEKSVAFILRKCLAATRVDFKLEGDHLVLYQKPPRKFTISGYIEDAKTGERLVAATIYEAQSGKGGTTNDYGFFSLKIPEGTASLHISYLGYQSSMETIPLTKNKTLSIALTPSITLEEIIVTAIAFVKTDAHLSLGKGEAVNLQQLATTIAIGGEPDVMRFLSTQAGVQSGVDGIGGLHVRGGNADQNLVLLDGIPIYNPSHTLGLFSIFNTHIIKSAHLLTDGFSAKYGGRLSSVIDVRVKEGNTKEWKAEGEVSTLATKLVVEGPLQKEKGGLLIAMRRTHIDPLLQRMSQRQKSKNDNEGEANYSFYDFNAKLHHRLSNKDQIFASLYKGKDDFRDATIFELEDFDFYLLDERQQELTWGNQIAALRWNHIFNDQLFSNTTFTFSQYAYDSANTEYYIDEFEEEIIDSYYYTTFQSNIKDIGLKMDLEYYPRPHHQLLFGGGLLFRTFESGELDVVLNETDTTVDIDEVAASIDEAYILPLFKATEINAYVEDRISLTKKFSLLAGLHVATFFTNNKTYLLPQPRIKLRWQLHPRWTTTLSGSRMSQFLHILSTSGGSLPNDLWVPSTKNVQPESAWQTAWTLTYENQKGWASHLDVFYKKLDHLIAYQELATLPGLIELDPTFWEEEITFGSGESYGWSTSIAKKKGTLTGQVSYAYTLSERQFEGNNNNQAYPFQYTHKHEIKVGLQQQLNPTTSFSLNWQYGSGLPYSLITTASRFAPLSNFYDPETTRIGAVNSHSLPAYHRLDVGFHFQWTAKKPFQYLHLGVSNLYNRKNPYYQYLRQDEFFPEENGLKQQNALPRLPSLSYRLVW